MHGYDIGLIAVMLGVLTVLLKRRNTLMAKISTLESTKVHRCMLFGPPKTGKTLLAGKLAEFYDLIWIDIENGHDVLFQLPTEWQERIELIALPDTRSYPIAIETCLKIPVANTAFGSRAVSTRSLSIRRTIN